MKDYLFTSESVSEGHPDKLCDRISDTILDGFLAQDPQSRVAVEALATTNRVVLAGEVRGPLAPEAMIELTRQAVKSVGYDQDSFHWRTLEVECLVHEQSPDIAQGVDASSHKEEGAGDQGLMFGYACRETPELMPAPVSFSHRILRALAEHRRADPTLGLGPDAKAQFTFAYEEDQPKAIHSIVVSTQHAPEKTTKHVRDLVCSVLETLLPPNLTLPHERLYVNPTGRFVIGGPDGDAGLTGRKIIVDTYGGAAPHGGGAFSGKDPTKVDRSAAYAARYLAKNVLAAGLADKCLIQLSYAIGMAQPVSFYVNCFGTARRYGEPQLAEALQRVMNLTPKGIREHLKLNAPIYARTSSYGHFGREPTAEGHFSWEKTDLVEDLLGLLS